MESGASLDNSGGIRPGLSGSVGTLNVNGTLIARRNLIIDAAGTADINLLDGLFQVGWVTNMTAAETKVTFDMQKGLFVSKANTDNDLVDDLTALTTAGFITASNGNAPGWGQATLGFTNYADLDYAIPNTAGTEMLYIDFAAAGSAWDGDGSVVTMWVEKVPPVVVT